MQHINKVKALPPRESLRILVNLESRNGICLFLSASLLMTLVNEKRLLLM